MLFRLMPSSVRRQAFLMSYNGLTIHDPAYAMQREMLLEEIQAVCALEAEVDYFVTRNPRYFSAMSIPVVRPVEVLNFLGP